MKQIRIRFDRRDKTVLWSLLALSAVAFLMLYRLGSQLPELSVTERTSASAVYGWHGISANPFFLPLNALRSLSFLLLGHSAFVTRLPNALFGIVTVGLFAVLIRFWHGNRTALFSTILFACSSWLLHISRLASVDVMYLLAVPLLLVVQLLMHKRATNPFVWYGSIAVCCLMLYVPGLVWLIALSLYWQRNAIAMGWRRFARPWQRALYVYAGIGWLPLLVLRLHDIDHLKQWLGLPHVFSIATVARQILFVPVHLLVRGPNDPERWLGHAPLLDVFSLALVALGLYFYVRHYRATRSRLLASYWLVGTLLVGLGGSVTLSTVVPLLYVLTATGVAYLVHEWLHVFPRNPIARQIGIGLVALAIATSCGYNLRAYFVAWPHAEPTLTAFQTSR